MAMYVRCHQPQSSDFSIQWLDVNKCDEFVPHALFSLIEEKIEPPICNIGGSTQFKGSQEPWQATGFPEVYGMMNRDDSSSNSKTDEKTKLRHAFSTNLKQILDEIPRLACVIVAVWDYFHTRDIERFVLLLAIGSTANYSLPKLKALAPRVVTLTRAIAAVLDKAKQSFIFDLRKVSPGARQQGT